MDIHNLKIAVLLPCFNEEGAIGRTVNGFKAQLPTAKIYVYDNNSTDNTVEEARQKGAIVRKETRQGKGEVVRRMFSNIDADLYVMADGDATYDHTVVSTLIETLLNNQLDMVIGTRSQRQEAYPKGHILGNKVFSILINKVFKSSLTDVFSGYRVMSKRFVKTVPIISDGFQIETELTVHALHHKIPIAEVPTNYNSRPEGTKSKLRTYSDGLKILSFIIYLIRDIKPLFFFSILSIFLITVSMILGIPVVIDFIDTGLVERVPTAILASSIVVISVISLFTGLMLDNVTKGRMNLTYLHYNNYYPVNIEQEL